MSLSVHSHHKRARKVIFHEYAAKAAESRMAVLGIRILQTEADEYPGGH